MLLCYEEMGIVYVMIIDRKGASALRAMFLMGAIMIELFVSLSFPFVRQVESFQKTSFHLSAYKGHLVILNFWASWCPPCQHEMPDIVVMYKKYHQQVTFIGVNLAGSDTALAAKQFVKRYHVPYRIVFDRNNELAQSFGILAVPTTLFIDQKGTVVYKIIGEMPQVMHRTFIQFLNTTQ